MHTYVSAPALCQGADEALILEMGAIIFPSFVQQRAGGTSLQLYVASDYREESSLKFTEQQFQVLLGILRAWRPIAGQRRDEIRPGIGAGSIQDELGNQVIHVGSVICYTVFGGDAEKYAHDAKAAIDRSQPLRKALGLNGGRDRGAGDYFMIYEYAKQEFRGDAGIARALSISRSEVEKLCSSANNLAPLDGGRHADQNGEAKWDLNQQRAFVARLLTQWISHRGRAAPSS